MRTLTLAFLAFALSAAQASASNLIVNGGFESGNFTGWSTQPAASGSNFGVIGFSHSGTFSARFGAVSGQHDSIWQNVPTAAGSRFTVSFWVYNGGVGSDSLRVIWDNSMVFNSTPLSLPASVWTEVTLTVYSTQATTQLRFEAYDSPSFIFLDDISVTSDNLIANPSFETADFTGWSTQAASSGSIFGVAASGRTGFYGAIFAALGSEHDQIWQTVPTEPGRVYILQFWVLNVDTGSDNLRVLWNGVPISDTAPMPTTGATYSHWSHLTFAVLATGTMSEVRFAGLDVPGLIAIDDVYLTPAATLPCNQIGDADRNGSVNFADITSVLSNWNAFCNP